MQNNALSAPMQTMAAMPKPKGKKPVAGDNRGELNRIAIEITENGFEVECSFDPLKIDPKFDRYNQMPEDTKMSFESPDSALLYIKKMMTGAAGEEAGEGDTNEDDFLG